MKENGYVIVTGASSGIGLEFAKIYAKNGYNLVLISRTEKALSDVRDSIQKNDNVRISIFPCDLREIENVKSFYIFLKNENISPRILINNAGFANFGRFSDANITKQMELIDLNIRSLTFMTKMFLDQLSDYANVRILNVSSIAGLLPGPFISVYAASKAYVYSFSQSIASELKSKGIQVSVFCPADVKTDFHKRAGIENLKIRMADPEEIVKKAYWEFMSGKRVIIPQTGMRLLRFSLSLFSETKVADTIEKQRAKW